MNDIDPKVKTAIVAVAVMVLLVAALVAMVAIASWIAGGS